MVKNEGSRAGIGEKLPPYGLCAELEGTKRIFNPLEPTFTFCTERFNIKKLCVLPTHCIYGGYVYIPEQTAIISLYSINQPLFITERQCGYRATRAAL